MKVLLTVHQFFPEFQSGTEVLTLSVAKELIRRGHEVHVYTGYPMNKNLLDNERFDEYEFEGIHVYRFHHAYVPMGGQSSLIEIGYDNHLAATRFEKILKSFKPNVVHFFHLNRLGTGLIEKANLAEVPAFATLTDFWPICSTSQLLLPDGKLCEGPNRYAGNCVKHFAQSSQKGMLSITSKWMPMLFVNFLTKLTLSNYLSSYPKCNEVKAIGARLGVNVSRLNQLKKIVAPNKMMHDVLVKNGVKADLIIQSSYGIDEVNVADFPHRVIRQPFRIGYIGTLAKHKGCHVLIEAFKTLPCNSAVLKIYGSPNDFPEYFNELKILATETKHVEFCGTFQNSKISQVIADFDVLVVPSIWLENTPLVIYSAQAVRCPVVASNFKGISDAVTHEESGLLFEPGNSADLTKQLVRLINEPDLAPKLSRNAKQPKSTSAYVEELLSIWKF